MGLRGTTGRWKLLLGLALLGPGLGACAEGGAEASQPVLAAATSQAALLDMAATAPTATMYRMTRRYEAHWNVAGVSQELAYRERVFSDGKGRFAIDPIEVLEPAMSPNEEGVFMVLQQLRAGFFFRHRDFGIRNVDRLLREWKVIDTGVSSQILGRTCANLDFRSLNAPQSTYHVALDIGTGLVLRVEEVDLAGNLMTLVEVESLSLTPDLSQVVFHQSLNVEQEFEPTNPKKALSLAPKQPKLLPKGYRLGKAVTLLEPTKNQTWVRFTYDDGLEELFFVHSGPSISLMPGVNAASTANTGKPHDVVKYLSIGPWTVLFGEVQDHEFIAMGKVSRGELVDMVDSALGE